MEKKRDDYGDFRTHPQWFDVSPVPKTLPPTELKQLNPKLYHDLIQDYINPGIQIKRKPIPFVLPIKGSAL